MYTIQQLNLMCWVADLRKTYYEHKVLCKSYIRIVLIFAVEWRTQHGYVIHNPGLTNFSPYLLTPWCRVLVEKLTVLQLVKKFPAFHGTRRFITALTSVCQLSVSWACPVQSIYPHPTSWRSILILSTHLRLDLPSGLFPSGFPTKTMHPPILTHMRHMPSRPHSSRFYHPHNIGRGVQII